MSVLTHVTCAHTTSPRPEARGFCAHPLQALTTQLRTKFKLEPCFYRVFPDGKVQYMHPKDGVYPEKVNAGRVGVNQNM